LGTLTLPVGILMRFFPVEEDPESFFDNSVEIDKARAAMNQKKQANLQIG
jgi:hypothetical protein